MGNASIAYQCLSSEDNTGIRQISFLQGDSRTLPPLTAKIHRLFGTGLHSEILTAYRFLVHNYMPDDEIYLIGAGRGGFILQCLADLISISGLLNVESFSSVSDAYTYSRLTEKARNGLSGQELRSRFLSRKVRVKFLGCWDPVGGLGAPTPLLGPFTKLWSEYHSGRVREGIDNIYQAFALDETNPRFTPNIMTGTNSKSLDTIEQVWFAGTHPNITGGQRDCRLSDIALRWLVSKAAHHGLALDTDKLNDLSTPHPLGSFAEETMPRRLMRLLSGKKTLRPVARADAHFSREQIPGTEKIHASVKTRERKDSYYNPDALAALPPGSLPVSQDESIPIKSIRKYDRQQVNCPATLLVDSRRLNGNMLDVSEGGARIWIPIDLPIGTLVTLRSSLLADDERNGHVVWTKDQSLGLEFSAEMDLEKLMPGTQHTLQ